MKLPIAHTTCVFRHELIKQGLVSNYVQNSSCPSHCNYARNDGNKIKTRHYKKTPAMLFPLLCSKKKKMMCRGNMPRIKEKEEEKQGIQKKKKPFLSKKKKKKKRLHGKNFIRKKKLSSPFLALLLLLLFRFLFPGLLFFFALVGLVVRHFDPFANVVIPAVTAKKNKKTR